MSAVAIDWRLPGCGPACWPRSHDPLCHEQYGRQQEQAQPAAPSVIRTGPLVVDLDAKTAAVDGQPVRPSGREWGILAYLAEHAGRFRTNDEIIAAVWGAEWVTGRRVAQAAGGTYRVDHRLVSVNVHRLRAKLGAAESLIVSVSHQGRSGRRLEMETPS